MSTEWHDSISVSGYIIKLIYIQYNSKYVFLSFTSVSWCRVIYYGIFWAEGTSYVIKTGKVEKCAAMISLCNSATGQCQCRIHRPDETWRQSLRRHSTSKVSEELLWSSVSVAPAVAILPVPDSPKFLADPKMRREVDHGWSWGGLWVKPGCWSLRLAATPITMSI